MQDSPRVTGIPRYQLPLTLLLVAACTGDGPVAAPPLADARAARAAVSAVDVDGAWRWSEVAKLRVPAAVAPMFGIPVEGPNTHLECASAGTMQLVQDGHTFSGSAQRTSITCETRGGIQFVPSPAFAPPSFPISDGVIHGRSLQFVAGDVLPAPHRAVVSASDAGVATALSGTARTIIPGHPKSPLPLDAPPLGTSKTVRWDAVRP